MGTPEIAPSNHAQSVARFRETFADGDLEAALERIRRTRLLDLTPRNRLLHFRHPGKSCLRITDELPDVIFQRLLSGQKLVFRPVPEPGLAEYGPNRRKPPADEYAAILGIQTSYDLPLPGSLGVAKTSHHDQYLQTLMYPDELDLIVRRMANAARTSVEESGTNMLYLALGFVEWTESPESESPRYAPLLTVPVNLSREKQPHGGAIRCCLEYSGEDLTVNLCLAEKLRRDFSLDLPDFDEEETPERYFGRVQQILAGRPGWKLRRWVTVCLLYFGRLLMYLDLDPKRWPSGAAIDQHQTIRELFGASPAQPTFGEDYNLDEPQITRDVPQLIYDADSSQHSALIDALRGRNLVIEGPPGTGKSQTITNLIAAALVRNKTVLFISEKLAALEVVRRRLDEAGLGTFCLELHSHKTQKQQLLKELEDRLHNRGHFVSPVGLDGKLHVLEENKRRLLEYVRLINSKFGAVGTTIFELLWARDRLRSQLPVKPEVLDSTLLADAESLTPVDIQSGRQSLDIYSGHALRILSRYRQIGDHPWCGVSKEELDWVGEQTLVALLASVASKAGELVESLGECGSLMGISIQDAVARIMQVAAVGDLLPRPRGTEIASVLPLLKERRNLALLSDFVEAVVSFRHDEHELEDEVSNWEVVGDALKTRLEGAVERASKLGISNLHTRAVRERLTRVKETAASLKTTVPFTRRILSLLGMDPMCRLDSLPPLASAVSLLLESTPFEILHLRCSELKKEMAATAIRSAAREAEKLRVERDALACHFVLEQAASAEGLGLHIRALEQAGLWQRCFGASYKAGRRYYRSVSRTARRASRDSMVASLRRLMTFRVRENEFGAHVCWTYVVGLQKGIDAPWEGLERLLLWYEELRRRLAVSSDLGSEVGNALQATATESLREVARFAHSDAEAVDRLRMLAEQVRDTVTMLTGTEISERDTLGAVIVGLESVAADLQAIVSVFSEAGINDALAIQDVPSILAKLDELRTRQAALNTSTSVSALLGGHFRGVATETSAIDATVDLAGKILLSDLPAPLRSWLLEADGPSRLTVAGEWCSSLLRLSGELSALWNDFLANAELNVTEWFRGWQGSPQPSVWILRERAKLALQSTGELSHWMDYCRARAGVEQARLGQLPGLVEAGVLGADDLGYAYDFVVANSLARKAIENNPALMMFSGLTHERVRREFARLDEEVIQLYRSRVAYSIDQRPVPEGIHTGPVGQRTDLDLIRREITKKTKRIPVRQLVFRAGHALQALKPCFMMGPLSVAQFLPPGGIEFDLVIMDEASQLKPEEALGAIARGKQVVIVGDPQQLPPTSFFDRSVDENDDPDGDFEVLPAEEGESILDVARSTYYPLRRLRWHYRSRHHSLIAFSNQNFYGEDLIVFPAAYHAAPDLGVRHVFVGNGLYQARRNPIEAQRIVDAVLDHMERYPHESLGVAAMNFTQSELIDELLDRSLRTEPSAQHFMDKWEREGEPFFIKNLENVQGDERDVVFISTTYGRDQKGNFYQRFGPINSATGYRRLNVLFTRAKKRTVVFTSIDPGWIHEGPTTARGAQVLKAYLEYAKTGVLDHPTASGGQPESDFEISVGNELNARGFETVAQVGVAGFFIDLGVKHPRRPGAFILGVECDGAAYHSGRSARDRDRIRQQALENLGWKIYRIWSTDWFKHRDREISNLIDRIGQILAIEESEEASRGLPPDRPASGPCAGTATEKEMLRRRLLQLRQTMEKECPYVPSERSLLREAMLEVFVQKRPTSRAEWFGLIPYDLRSSTDLLEIRQYLPKVFEILSE